MLFDLGVLPSHHFIHLLIILMTVVLRLPYESFEKSYECLKTTSLTLQAQSHYSTGPMKICNGEEWMSQVLHIVYHYQVSRQGIAGQNWHSEHFQPGWAIILEEGAAGDQHGSGDEDRLHPMEQLNETPAGYYPSTIGWFQCLQGEFRAILPSQAWEGLEARAATNPSQQGWAIRPQGAAGGSTASTHHWCHVECDAKRVEASSIDLKQKP